MAGVRVDGIRQTIRNLERLGAEVADLKEVMYQAAQPTATRARALTPSRTGRAAGSIRVGKAKGKATVRAGGARAFYFRFLEFGSIHNRPPVKPLRTAADQTSAQVVAAVDMGLKRVLDRISN